MPFITEEIWQSLKARLNEEIAESIMIAPYPTADEAAIDAAAEKQMELVIDVVRSIRNERAEFGVEPSKWIEALIVPHDAKSVIESQVHAIETLGRVRPLTIIGAKDTRPDKAKTLVLSGAEVILPMAGMVDIEVERQRLETEIEENQAEITRLEARLKDEQFLSRAPAHIVSRERQRLEEYITRSERLSQRLAELG